MLAKQLLITGQVQGVFFRAETERMAKSLGLAGWVRNTEDGAVEIHAEGADEKMRIFEEWCRRGPSRAHVENVTAREVTPEQFQSFEIRH